MEGKKKTMQGEASKMIEKAMGLMVCELASKYKFDSEEAMRYLGLNGVKQKEIGLVKEKENDAVVKKKGSRKKKVPLPWTGKVCEERCAALCYNNGLFTQCDEKKGADSNYCGECINSKDENNGYFVYGTVEDRLKEDFNGKGGKGLIPYGNVLKKKNITREEALAAAAAAGVELTEECFNVEVRKRGRPKKVSVAVDDTPEKKKKGRPGKRKTTTVDDTDIIRGVVEKQEEEDEEEEEEEEEEITVSEFTHDGKKYLRSSDNVLYDADTQEILGTWDEEKKIII